MSNMPDLSSLLGMLNDKGVDINSLIQNFSNSNFSQSNTVSDATPNLDDILNNVYSSKSSNSSDSAKSDDPKMPDMETMMKIMNLMKSINTNTPSPSANLLYSLKPFLRDSKKEKVDQYIKFLKISSIFSELNKSGGDLK